MKPHARQRGSLIRRLALPLAGIVLAAAALQIGVAYRSMLQETNEVFDYQLKQMAQALALGAAEPARGGFDRESGQADALDLVFRETTADGTSRGNAHGALPRNLPAGYADVSTRLGELRAYTLAIGGREVTVAQRWSARRALARDVAFDTLWPLATLAVASLLLVILMLRAALRPITALERQVRQRDPASLAPLLDPGLPLELRPLLHAANDLIARLSEALAHQRRFLADAAHELRTPISAIRLQNTLVAKADSDEERQHALAAQDAGIRRASVLVDQLLRLSRLEAPDATRPTVRFDLAAEVHAQVSMHASEARAKAIALTQSGESMDMRGDPALVAAAIGNLIANAVRHCPHGSHVAVTVACSEGDPVVVVEDDGPGIPEHALAAMMQPFRRGESASAPGSGLGLAIVQATCARAGWTLYLGAAAGHGLRATVRMRAGGS
ncbi:MAG: hypothetical protein JSR26_12185 [Proteobacteria bacterium]|nr:hypothetical protein [Pseudomonadota bacterium]